METLQQIKSGIIKATSKTTSFNQNNEKIKVEYNYLGNCLIIEYHGDETWYIKDTMLEIYLNDQFSRRIFSGLAGLIYSDPEIEAVINEDNKIQLIRYDINVKFRDDIPVLNIDQVDDPRYFYKFGWDNEMKILKRAATDYHEYYCNEKKIRSEVKIIDNKLVKDGLYEEYLNGRKLFETRYLLGAEEKKVTDGKVTDGKDVDEKVTDGRVTDGRTPYEVGLIKSPPVLLTSNRTIDIFDNNRLKKKLFIEDDKLVKIINYRRDGSQKNIKLFDERIIKI